MRAIAEYIWLDGEKPTQQLRSKSRILELSSNPKISEFPNWSFDGSSTYQADRVASDLEICPKFICNNPLKLEPSFLVLSEVYQNALPHSSNTRHNLQKLINKFQADAEPLVGFEQEYTLFSGHTPLGWPDNGYPRPQGPFYCGVGADRIFGREIAEQHLQACMDADLSIYGINAEVMPGQWEFQIGPRGFNDEQLDVLTISDHLIIARWLLHRIAEQKNITVSFANKPIKGDWNGSGCHTNFSTKQMRDPNSGLAAIEQAIELLRIKHSEHIKVYGANLNERLTGLHETAHIDEFAHGTSDRGKAIRIPSHVKQNGYGYLEDRRPGSNCDPYLVTTRLIQTICDYSI